MLGHYRLDRQSVTTQVMLSSIESLVVMQENRLFSFALLNGLSVVSKASYYFTFELDSSSGSQDVLCRVYAYKAVSSAQKMLPCTTHSYCCHFVSDYT
jgi:hypothetical protein